MPTHRAKRPWIHSLAISCAWMFVLCGRVYGGPVEPVPPKLVLASIATPGSAEATIVSSLYEEISQRLGITIHLDFLPALRAQTYLRYGKVDGDAHRFRDFNKAQPDLVRVEEPLVMMTIGAFSRSRTLVITGWDSLKGQELTIDRLRGHIYYDLRLETFADKARILTVDTTLQGLKRLATGRTDLFIDTLLTANHYLKHPEVNDAGIRCLCVLGKVPLHCFLHKKHAALVPAFSHAIKTMNDEDYIARIVTQVLSNDSL